LLRMASVMRGLLATVLCAGVGLAVAPRDAPTHDQATLTCAHAAAAAAVVDWTIDTPDFVAPAAILAPGRPAVAPPPAPPAAAPDLDDDAPPGLHADGDDPRHAAAAHWLAISLERMTPLAATSTACRWALSPDPDQRATIASALEWTFALLGDSLIIDHLS